MRSRHCTLLAVLLSVLAASAPAPGLAAPPAIYTLGNFNDELTIGWAVNDSGQVSGMGTNTYGAFIYTGTPGSDGGMHDLGIQYGGDVNDAGQVVGTYLSHACLYTGAPGRGGVIADLGTLGGPESAGIGINNSGQVVGYSKTASGASHAFLYTGTPGSGGAMADLGTLGGTLSGGTEVNDSGQVAGYSKTASGETHAFLYTGAPGSGGAMADLGALAGDSFSYSAAINEVGQVVGWSERSAGIGSSHAFLYSGTPGAGGQMINLGTLGGSQSWAHDINDTGQIVGSSYIANGAFNGPLRAFLYTGKPGVDGRMIDLEAWLDANNPVEGAKWHLNYAYGLSNNGWITGTGGYYDGPGGMSDGAFAFLLDASSLLIPEPSSLSLLTLAAPMLMFRHRRRTVCARPRFPFIVPRNK
jgi:probable HAF family extracellular repeat protein